MKTSIWKKFFRKGYNASGGGFAAKFNGWSAKTDAHTTRTKLKRELNKLFPIDEPE